MSSSEEDSYSTIFASLKHPIRRKILRILSSEAQTFSDLQKQFKIESSHLTYHIDGLGNLLYKTEDGKYALSSLGEAAMSTITKVEDIPTTALHQLSETRIKKVAGRSVAIALGIISILLVAGLVGAFAYYVNDKNNTISLQHLELLQLHDTNANLGIEITQLQAWLDGNETLLNQTQADNTNLQNQIGSLNSSVINLQNQMNNFYIGNTENSTIWINNEILNMNEDGSVQTGENVSVVGIDVVGLSGFVPSAGYVSIRVSSNNNSTYVALSHLLNNSNSTYLFDFDYQISVGFGGTVVFPVLPNSMIMIAFGCSFGEATLTVTITYYY